MVDPKINAIHNDPKYQKFIKSSSRFSWAMTIIMLVLYFGYIGLVAFDKDFLARSVGDGVTTLSIPVGVGLIIVTVLLALPVFKIAWRLPVTSCRLLLSWGFLRR